VQGTSSQVRKVHIWLLLEFNRQKVVRMSIQEAPWTRYLEPKSGLPTHLVINANWDNGGTATDAYVLTAAVYGRCRGVLVPSVCAKFQPGKTPSHLGTVRPIKKETSTRTKGWR
jgi:hypothetical protein